MCGKKEYICQGQSHNYLRKQNIQSFAPPPAVFGAIALGEPCYRNAVANTSRRIILNAPEKGRCITTWPLLESTTTTFNPHRSGMGGASAVQPEFLHQPGRLSMLTTPVRGSESLRWTVSNNTPSYFQSPPPQDGAVHPPKTLNLAVPESPFNSHHFKERCDCFAATCTGRRCCSKP